MGKIWGQHELRTWVVEDKLKESMGMFSTKEMFSSNVYFFNSVNDNLKTSALGNFFIRNLKSSFESSYRFPLKAIKNLYFFWGGGWCDKNLNTRLDFKRNLIPNPCIYSYLYLPYYTTCLYSIMSQA